MSKPKIVVIGGGTGLPVVLKSLRKKNVEITAIVTVADDGGSSGKLRTCLKIAPPGDLRNVLVALSDMPKFYENLFQYRFQESDGTFSNHALGNIIIAALTEMHGSMYEAIQKLARIMRVSGKIYPSSCEALNLHAVFTDGSEVVGESSIAPTGKIIDHVYVTNTYNSGQPHASPKVTEAISQADLVVLGPGSLFTSVLPNLVIDDVRQAIVETPAEIAYICNIMTQKGETEHFTDADHIKSLHHNLGCQFIDTVLVNIEPVFENYLDHDRYGEYLDPVSHDFAGLKSQVGRVISTNFLKLEHGGIFHDGDLVAQELLNILSSKFVSQKRVLI